MFEIRKTRTVAQGRRKLTVSGKEYVRLVQQGVSYAEAAKAVGINLRTGKRWRNGRNPSGRQKAAPPARPEVRPSGASRYLREAGRIYIAGRLLEGATARAIAAELGRSPPPSAGRSAATGTPSTASTVPSPPRPARMTAVPAPSPEDQPGPRAAGRRPGRT